jgi:hypothetical protein
VKRLLSLLAAAAIAATPGCVGYSSYPEVDSLAPSSPNFIQVKPVITSALKEVVRRYHPDWAGPFAINLPPEMTPESQADILRDLGPDARPMTPQTQHLPTYHVGRVWVRGPKAKVDVVRPVLELGPAPDGGIVYQGVTVWLDAGLNPWQVDFIQPWSMAVAAPPDANFVQLPAARPEPTEPSTEPATEPPAEPAAEPEPGPNTGDSAEDPEG